MVVPNNDPFVMTKPNVLRMGRGKKKSSRETSNKKYDFMILDCCSFLGLGLGFEESLHLSHYASVALMNIDDNENESLLEDNGMEADFSTRFGEASTLDVHPDETINRSITNYEEKKTVCSTPTVSTLTVEKIIDGRIVEDGEQQELRSKLVFAGHLAAEERTFLGDDGEDSKTLNTLSVSRMPSSLDTATLQLTPSLDTKTWSANQAELGFVETIIGDTKGVDTIRSYGNDSQSRPYHLYQTEGVPSMVDTFDNDDQSVVSIMSNEDIFSNKDHGTTSDRIGFCATEGYLNRKRLFGGRVKLQRSWPWNKRGIQRRCHGSGLQSNRTKWVLQTPPPPTSSDAPREIEPIKSINALTTTIDTNDDRGYSIYYRENIPFDEPIGCSPGVLASV